MKQKIAGHSDAVLCCHVMAASKLLVSGGEDGRLCFTDMNTLTNTGTFRQTYGDAVTSVCSSPVNEHLVYASAGQTVMAVDVRKGLSDAAVCDEWALNQDEINHIAVNRQGSWLAAGDDLGEVQMINLHQSRDGVGRPAYKTLRRGHSNICSAVAFRPHRPWELVSGGLDSTVVRWDFNRLRPQQSWSLSTEAAASGGQLINPPMVHSLVVPETEDRDFCRLMAVGRGDGYISLYDIDSNPTLPPCLRTSTNSSGIGGSSRKKGRKVKQKGGGTSRGPSGTSRSGVMAGQSGDNITSATAVSGECSSAVDAAAPASPGSDSDACRVPFVPGRICLLGREQGGHTAAVNCLTFLQGSHWRLLLSAGNDGRLVLWDWQAAAARQAAAWSGAEGKEGPGDDAKQRAGAAGGTEEDSLRECGSVQNSEGSLGAAKAEAASGGRSEAATVVIADVGHGRKINCVCSCESVGGYNVFVADVTPNMTAMTLR